MWKRPPSSAEKKQTSRADVFAMFASIGTGTMMIHAVLSNGASWSFLLDGAITLCLGWCSNMVESQT
jgi:hypothetical protein